MAKIYLLLSQRAPSSTLDCVLNAPGLFFSPLTFLMGFKSFAKFGKLKMKFEVCYFGKKKKKNQNKCKGFIINIQSNTKYQEKKNT